MRIKLNETKKLEFDIDTVGCSWDNLKGCLRFVFENIEYGFPVDFKDGKITATIPPFENVISQKLNESIFDKKEIDASARLDIIANGNNYVVPWSDEVKIEVPVSVRIKSDKMRGIIEAAKDVKVNDPKITTVSTAEVNPLPFDKVLKSAKQEADAKAKENARQEKRKEKTKLGSVLMGRE